MKKLNNIFDTHAHYEDEDFDDDRDKLLSSLPSKGISGVICCGTTLLSSYSALELSKKYDYMYAACGIYPHESINMRKGDMDVIKEMLSDKKAVAVGEIGLDYHYDDAPRELQLETFEEFLKMANDTDKPVIVHDREAHEDTLSLLKKYRPRGVIHCFSGSIEIMNEIMKLGMYIGLGGAVTFKNAKKSLLAAAQVPSDRLLLETDAPYMTPVPMRGQRNTSDLISFTAECIAGIRGTDAQSICDMTNDNAHKLFGI